MIVAMQVVTGDGSRVPAILLANKCDLREESTEMSMILMMSLSTMPMFMNTYLITKLIKIKTMILIDPPQIIIINPDQNYSIEDFNIAQVSDAEIEQFAKEHGFAAWYRVSAKEGTQVQMIDEGEV